MNNQVAEDNIVRSRYVQRAHGRGSCVFDGGNMSGRGLNSESVSLHESNVLLTGSAHCYCVRSDKIQSVQGSGDGVKGLKIGT